MNIKFEKMNQKMDFIRENLEKQILSNEILILSTKENLEKQIGFQQKLLWVILTVVIGSLVKSLIP